MSGVNVKADAAGADATANVAQTPVVQAAQVQTGTAQAAQAAQATPMALRVSGLSLSIKDHGILHDVSFSLPDEYSLAIVGESGSGKSMTARSLAGLLPDGATVSGKLLLDGHDIDLAGSEKAWRQVRGNTVVWLPQNPFASMNPLRKCGPQVADGLQSGSVRSGNGGETSGTGDSGQSRRKLSRAERRAAVERLLRDVGLEPSVYDAYPHQLSGGMLQRVAIAAAIAPNPRILIADEPTTALDAQTQAGVLDLLDSLRSTRHMAVVLITHDLALASSRAQQLVVFNAGRVVESGATEEIVRHSKHEYTRQLLNAHHLLDAAPVAFGDDIVVARNVSKTYAGASVPALQDASIHVAQGEIVGIVGESGSGKSTLAKCLVGLEQPDSGSVEFHTADGKTSSWNKRMAQVVFQNPYGSLNPSMTVRQTLVEALGVVGRPASDVDELIALVGLEAELLDRKPGKLSGGQCQRVAIARALAPEPRLIIADEAVSALDATIQTVVLDTLLRLRERLGIGILFISHDLDVVRRIADRIYVIYHSRIVESGGTDEVLDHPKNDYVKALIAAMPKRSE